LQIFSNSLIQKSSINYTDVYMIDYGKFVGPSTLCFTMIEIFFLLDY